MDNRISELFKIKKDDIVSIYVTAGYPGINDTVPIIKSLDNAGADIIEIGFPFSDPLADGIVIQKSSNDAIKNGMTLNLLFEQLENIRSITQIPIVLMGYLNPMLQYGEKAFINKCGNIGIDGIIIPDMPPDYYLNNLEDICVKNNIANIMLISPQTPDNRIYQIDAASKGFLYMVSSNRITGGSGIMEFDFFRKVSKMALKNPVLTGFGIRSGKDFKNVCRYSNGAVIGSAFIEFITANGISEDQILHFIQNIKS